MEGFEPPQGKARLVKAINRLFKNIVSEENYL
jgi:hypothetical protein